MTRFMPPKATPDNLPEWLDEKADKYNGHGYADFKNWFDNGATNVFIMEKTGIRTQNTVRRYRKFHTIRQSKD